MIDTLLCDGRKFELTATYSPRSLSRRHCNGVTGLDRCNDDRLDLYKLAVRLTQIIVEDFNCVLSLYRKTQGLEKFYGTSQMCMRASCIGARPAYMQHYKPMIPPYH